MGNLSKVYLAGGLTTNWRQPILDELDNHFIFFNPQDHGLEECSKQFTNWDLFHVKQCDIVFAYMEENNLSGYGLTLEVGYAKALDKLIILVDEKSINDKKFSNYFRIVRESATITFNSLEKGLHYLKSFQPKQNYQSI
jgi:nucleoside 2-deoxyribosyltransferase